MIHALLIPNVGWPELLARARRLEELGVSTVWVDDHILNPAHPEQPWLDAWSVLPALAAATTTIRLGPLVANGILRSPATLVRHALSVAHISGGRLELGLGAGYAKGDHAAGAEHTLAELVTTVDKARRGEPILDGFPPLAPTEHHIPLTIAAHGRHALHLAATHADRWVSYGGFGLDAEELLSVTRKRIAILEEVGRPVRRMLLAGSPAVTATPIWQSVGAVTDFVGQHKEAGIDEFAFYYPPGPMWSDPKADKVFEDYVAS